MGQFDEFYKKLKEYVQILEKFKETNGYNNKYKGNVTDIRKVDLKDLTYEDYVNFYNSDQAFNNLKIYLYDTIIHQIDNPLEFIDYMINHPLEPRHQPTNFYGDSYQSYKYAKTDNPAIKKLLEDLDEAYKEKLAILPQESRGDYKARIIPISREKLKEFYERGNQIEGFKEFIAENNLAIFHHIDFIDLNQLGVLDKFIENLKNYGINLEVLDLNKAQATYNFNDVLDNHPYQDKINQMIKDKANNSDNKNLTEALEKANTFIIHADVTATHVASNVAEKYGEQCDYKAYNGMKKYLMKDHPELLDYIEYDNENLQLKSYPDPQGERLVRKALMDKIVLPEDFKNTIKHIYQEMVEAEFIDPKKFYVETPGKIYGFTKLCEDISQTMEAIDQADTDKIISSVETYKKDEALADQLIQELNTLCPEEYITGNISSSREGAIPSKYRNDPIGSSKLSAMWLLGNFLEKYNISIVDFLEDPFREIDKKANELIDKTFSNSLMAEKNYASMCDKLYNAGIPEKKELDIYMNEVYRIGALLIRLLPESDLRHQFQTQFYLNNAVKYRYIQIINPDKADVTTLDNPKDRYKDLLVVEPEDRVERKICNGYVNPFSGRVTHFDRERYIRSHQNVEGIILRAYQVQRDFKKRVYQREEWYPDALAAANEVIKELDALATHKTPLTQEAMAILKKGNTIKKTMLENLEAVNQFKKYSVGGITDENVAEAAQVYNNLKRSYNHRSGWAKFFYHNVKEQKTIIGNFEAAFQKAHYDKATLDNIIAGRIMFKKSEKEPEFEEFKDEPIEAPHHRQPIEVNIDEAHPENSKDMQSLDNNIKENIPVDNQSISK